ncbi:MAG: glycosyltransferase [Bdellovibrionales bacterium]|nr:glycosyltransferase [Bdellovibrionales bacterium]
MTIQPRKMPLVSVIVPSYNHEQYIEEAIFSVINQTYSNIELIIVDDGSHDNSREIIKKIILSQKQNGTKIKFIKQRNSGAHAAINKGLRLARGEYLTILNSDDRFHPQRIERLVSSLKGRDEGFAFTLVQHIDSLGDPLDCKNRAVFGYNTALSARHEYPSLGYALLISNIAITTGNFFFTRNLFKKIGQFKSYRVAHDWDFLLRALYYTEPIFLQEKLIDYRIHETNTVSSSEELCQSESLIILTDYFKRLLDKSPPNHLLPCPQYWPNYFYSFIRNTYSSLAREAPYRDSGIIFNSLSLLFLEIIKSKDPLKLIHALTDCQTGHEFDFFQCEPSLIGRPFAHVKTSTRAGLYFESQLFKIANLHSAHAESGHFYRVVITGSDLSSLLHNTMVALCHNGQIAGLALPCDLNKTKIQFYVYLPKAYLNVPKSKLNVELLVRTGESSFEHVPKSSNQPISLAYLQTSNKELVWRNVVYRLSPRTYRCHITSLNSLYEGVVFNGWVDNSQNKKITTEIRCVINGTMLPIISWVRHNNIRHNNGLIDKNDTYPEFTLHLRKNDIEEFGRELNISILSFNSDQTAETIGAYKLSSNGFKYHVTCNTSMPTLNDFSFAGEGVLLNKRSRQRWDVQRPHLQMGEVKTMWGFIEKFERINNGIAAQGWSINPHSKRAPDQILICSHNKVFASVRPNIYREDIINLHKVTQPINSGFFAQFELPSPETKNLRMVAIWHTGEAISLPKLYNSQ